MPKRSISLVVILFVGLALTLSLTFITDRQVKQLQLATLDANAKRWMMSSDLLLQQQSRPLLSLLKTIEQLEEPTLAAITKEIEATLQDNPLWLDVFWVPEVAQDDRAMYEATMRRQRSGFFFKEVSGIEGVRPAVVRQKYFPAYYSLGVASTEAYLGLDLASFSSMLNAFDIVSQRQANSGSAVYAAGFVPDVAQLLQGKERPDYRLLLVTPSVFNLSVVNGQGASANSFLAVLIDAESLFEDLGLIDGLPLISMKVLADDALLFLNRPTQGILDQEFSTRYDSFGPYASDWQLQVVPTDQFFSSQSNQLVFWVAGFGLLATMLTSSIVLAASRREKQVAGLVVEREDELAQAQATIERLSLKDRLTQVSNRYYFDERLAVEWRRSVREKSPITLLLIDVDCFSAYKEQQGNAKADVALRKIAEVLTELVKRPADTIARFDEQVFAVLLPNTDESAVVLAEHICVKVETLNLPHEGSGVSPMLTVSIGMSTISPVTGQPQSSLIKGADNSLSKAKAEGKNRVANVY